MFTDLIRYTELADQKIIETFLSTDGCMPQAEFLFSHVLNAQHIWLSRIHKINPQFDRFSIHKKSQFQYFHQENISALNNVLNHVDLDLCIDYTISTGELFTNTVSDILFHIINHSTYHRAQIATQFKLHHIAPPITDYVFLKRQTEF